MLQVGAAVAAAHKDPHQDDKAHLKQVAAQAMQVSTWAYGPAFVCSACMGPGLSSHCCYPTSTPASMLAPMCTPGCRALPTEPWPALCLAFHERDHWRALIMICMGVARRGPFLLLPTLHCHPCIQVCLPHLSMASPMPRGWAPALLPPLPPTMLLLLPPAHMSHAASPALPSTAPLLHANPVEGASSSGKGEGGPGQGQRVSSVGPGSGGSMGGVHGDVGSGAGLHGAGHVPASAAAGRAHPLATGLSMCMWLAASSFHHHPLPGGPPPAVSAAAPAATAVGSLQAALNATASGALAVKMTTDALTRSATEEADELLDILTQVQSACTRPDLITPDCPDTCLVCFVWLCVL